MSDRVSANTDKDPDGASGLIQIAVVASVDLLLLQGRPHQALNMQCPVERYQPSSRPYRGLPELDYPLHDKAATVTTCGRICFNNQKINLSQVFAGQTVGIKQTDERIWLVSFMDYDLGYFDDETCRLEPLANPFGPKVLPMSSE
jgi:putative transposase